MGIKNLFRKRKKIEKKVVKKPKLKKKEQLPKESGRSIAWRVLIKPWITEKATLLQKQGKYVFEVDSKATKSEIKKAIETYYKVKVVQVNILKVKGKIRRLGRVVGKTRNRKKAIVTINKGDTIKFE